MSLSKIRLPQIAAAVLLGMVLVACGSGSDGFIAGIEGTGVTSGFGSVFVNGREFATDDAQIIINGEQGNESQLRAGDIISVSGTLDGGGNAVANRIEFNRVVDGPIQSLDIINGRGSLMALGQTVQIGPSTSFINTSVDDLAMNDLIAVSAMRDANGVLQATSVEENANAYVPNVTRIDTEGIVSNFDPGQMRFDIDGLTVDYSGITGSDAFTSSLADGVFAEVFGRQNGAGMPLVADIVNLPDRSVGQAGERAEIDAIITDFNGADSFRLNGQPVDVANAQRSDSTNIDLSNGVRVAVSGILRLGIVEVDSLEVRPSPSVGFTAVVDTVTPDTVTLLGQSGQVQAATLYLDNAQNSRVFRIDSLQPGDTVMVLGFRDVEGQLLITRLERQNPQPDALAWGPVQGFDANNRTLRIDGVVVRADSNTEYLNADGSVADADSFFASLRTNDTVEATGSESVNEINPARQLQNLNESR